MAVNLALTNQLSNFNARQAYSKTTSFAHSVSSPVITKSNTYEGITDSVKLSSHSINAFSNRWIKEQLDNAVMLKDSGEYVQADDIAKDYAEKLAGFAGDFRKVLYASDIAIDSEMRLQTDGLGHVLCVDTEREKAAELNETLRNSLGVTSGFMGIAASESIVSHIKDAPDFIQKYADDPQETLKGYENSLRRYVLGLQLHVRSDSITSSQADPLFY